MLTIGSAASLPVFTTQPTPATQTVSTGSNVSYSVVAAGATSFQWTRDGVAVSGANTATLTLNSVQPSQAGSYAAVATNAVGSITSANAVLTVSVGGDTSPPTAPGNLASPTQTSTTISLTWTPSTDNVGVAGYAVYRGSSQVTVLPAAGLSFTDSGLTPAATYVYTLRAFDAAGNYSSPSNSVTQASGTAGTQNDASNQNLLNIHIPL